MFPDDDVRTLMGLPSTDDVSLFCISARDIIRRKNLGATYDDATIRLITIWLAAYLRDGTKSGGAGGAVVRQKIGQAEEEYSVNLTISGLQANRYGQGLLALDTSGLLRDVGKRRPQVFAMGPVPLSENITE